MPDPGALDIELTVERAGAIAWQGSTTTGQMQRLPLELVGFLFRAEQFPDGVVLTTGTGIVPGMEFTLHEGDQVTVRIRGIGVLANTVAVGPEQFGWLADRTAGNRSQRELDDDVQR